MTIQNFPLTQAWFVLRPSTLPGDAGKVFDLRTLVFHHLFQHA